MSVIAPPVPNVLEPTSSPRTSVPVDVGTARRIMITPIGELLICACAEGLSRIYFEGQWSHSTLLAESQDERALAFVRLARTELAAYFGGNLRTFSVPCFLQGTSFQRGVWQALQRIQFGDVVAYRVIAERIGNPKAVRAVGAANGQNPIPVIIPCHRVIGSDGTLTGFGGGLERKQWLLEHEGTRTRELVS